MYMLQCHSRPIPPSPFPLHSQVCSLHLHLYSCLACRFISTIFLDICVQMSSVSHLCLTLCDPTDCSTPGFAIHHQPPKLAPIMSIKSVMPSSHLILCRPLFLPPSIFPSIMVSFNESVFRIKWPKYWSFSLSISPSNEYSGLISFRID